MSDPSANGAGPATSIPPRRAAILGLIQGPTELLPVSSSAHLGLVPWLAGWDWDRLDPELRKSFEVALHAGAAGALLIGQRQVIAAELRSFDARRAAVLALSFAPAALAAFFFERPIERRLGGPRATALGLFAGSAAMVAADTRPQRRGRGEAHPLDGLVLGVAQAAALAPGVSRNGATLAAARLRCFDRDQANLLSRTVALPIITAAAILKGGRLRRRRLDPAFRTSIGVGVATSFASTLASQGLINQVERDRPFWPYAAYRVALAGFVLSRLRRRSRAPGRLDPAAVARGPPDRAGVVSGDGAYARAGVDQGAADAAVAALVEALGSIELGRSSRVLDLPGHYASVIRLDERIGIALSTDGVGTKLALAQQMERYDSVGIDCVAMNVNDVICVGAEPLAMLDYIAIEQADPEVCRQIGVGLARGAQAAAIEIPGGELAQLGELVRGFDLAGACFGTVALDRVIDGAAVRDGDPVIGLPSSGLHSNGFTLARKALDGIPLDDRRLGDPLGEVLLTPTEIYVRAILGLLRSDIEVRGLAHVTSGGLGNLLRLRADCGYEIDEPLPVPPVFALIQELGDVSDEEMHEVFNMGCGFCVVVAARDEEEALTALRAHYPEARRIGRARGAAGAVHRRA